MTQLIPMRVAVGHQCEKTRAFDCHCELSLVPSTGSCDPAGYDLSGLGNKIIQGIQIFVIDFLDAFGGKTAKLFAFIMAGHNILSVAIPGWIIRTQKFIN